MTDTTSSKKDIYKDLAERIEKNLAERKRISRWIAAFAIPIGLALVPIFMLWHAYVAAKLWLWFGQPVFGIHLSTFHTAGLTIFARLICIPSGWFKQEGNGLINNALVPLVCLGAGAFWYWLGWGL